MDRQRNWETIFILCENEDEPQNEGEVTAVSIQHTKHALKTLSNFLETTTGMGNGGFSALSDSENTVEDKIIKRIEHCNSKVLRTYEVRQ